MRSLDIRFQSNVTTRWRKTRPTYVYVNTSRQYILSSSVRPDFMTCKPKGVNQANGIGAVGIEIQATRIPNWVLANKPPYLRIIVPMPVVMQPRFMVVILPLKPKRVGQSFTLRPFRQLFLRFTPSLVLCAPGNSPLVVSQLLRRAQMIALIPRQHIQGLCCRLVVPQRVIIEVVGTFVSRRHSPQLGGYL